MDKPEPDYTFRILLTGVSTWGKTSILLKFSDDIFPTANMPTIGVDNKTRTIEVDDKTINLLVWDIIGLGRFKSIVS